MCRRRAAGYRRCRLGEVSFWVSSFEEGTIPSFEEGSLRPLNKMSRYLRQGAAGEVRHTHKSDLPRHAEAKEAWHLIVRRGDPSSKEGIVPRPR
jgi:hypothetical protein